MPRKRPPFGGRHGLRWQYLPPLESFSPGALNPALNIDVGSRLRQIREGKALTIRALAEQSGLAINTLSLIENGKSSPSVSTLQQLAVTLDIPITTFFETDQPRNNIAHIKADCRPRAEFDHGLLEDLAAGSTIHAVEPFVITLEPNAFSGPDDIVHTGYEFIYCLEGRIAYTIERQTYLLEPGDSLLFEAHLPHRWQNLSPTRSQSILVIYPTDEHEHPTERHFLQR